MHSKLEIFLRTPSAKDKYHQALRLLDEAGALDALRELGGPQHIPKDVPNRMEVAASEHFRSVGYQNCLYDLTTLTEMSVNGETKLIADFGAIERMLERGEITKQQADQLRTQT